MIEFCVINSLLIVFDLLKAMQLHDRLYLFKHLTSSQEATFVSLPTPCISQITLVQYVAIIVLFAKSSIPPSLSKKKINYERSIKFFFYLENAKKLMFSLAKLLLII